MLDVRFLAARLAAASAALARKSGDRMYSANAENANAVPVVKSDAVEQPQSAEEAQEIVAESDVAGSDAQPEKDQAKKEQAKKKTYGELRAGGRMPHLREHQSSDGRRPG